MKSNCKEGGGTFSVASIILSAFIFYHKSGTSNQRMSCGHCLSSAIFSQATISLHMHASERKKVTGSPLYPGPNPQSRVGIASH